MHSAKVKWLLLADIHFKHQDLSRITQTAAWIKSVAERHRVHRVVICGDLLTCRSSQPTHVLSACYRFLGSLVHDAQVAHVHVLLGNHDLAYRRDYSTTALDALQLAAPVVQLHRDVVSRVWDGRRVLMLPFREDQSELTDTVAALDRDDAAKTIAFAHLAIHRAVIQRHDVRTSSCATSRKTGSVAYHGLIGSGCFSSLARTFTGHFHSHQTILQQPPMPSARGCTDETETACLRGSVTYVGSPLQLTWADLWDEQRGVILLDPETLDHELVVNPYAVGYITARVEEVLRDSADPAVVCGRHVMLLGDLTPLTYAAARDKLVSLGARSIRSWSPVAPAFRGTVKLQGLGASTPASDSSLHQSNLASSEGMDDVGTDDQTAALGSTDPTPPAFPPQPQCLDIREQVAAYMKVIDLDKSLEESRELLVRVGQKLLEAATSEKAEGENQALGWGQPETLSYKCIVRSNKTGEVGKATDHVGTTPKTELDSPNVFNAHPRSLTIANFLGIESQVRLKFGADIRRGLTFLVGENGSGKSTLVEAVVWCQFGRCLRSGLGVNDVVNDKARRDCSVRMEFDNGYAIQRFRKHKQYGNRIVVERDGKVLPEFEKADARSTQAAINELLGVDYDTFVRTIVLSRESTSSFLNSTSAERRALILSSLGLQVLDRFASIARRFLRELDDDMAQLQAKLDGLEQRISHLQEHIMNLTNTEKRLEDELGQIEVQRGKTLADLEVTTGLDTSGTRDQPVRLEDQMSAAQQQLDSLLHRNGLADIRRAFEAATSIIQDRRLTVLNHLTELKGQHSQLLLSKSVADEKPIAQLNAPPMLSWFLNVIARMHQRLQSMHAALVSCSSYYSSRPMQRQRVIRRSVTASLEFLCRILAKLGRLIGVDARKEANVRGQQELLAFQVRSEDLEGKITQQRRELSRLEYLVAKEQTIQQIATERGMSERDVRDNLEEVSADDAKTIAAQLNAALKTLADLQHQRELHAAKHAQLEELQAAARAKSVEMATYRQISEEETSVRQNLELEYDVLRNNLATLAADRIPFDFWVSALAQKSRRISSPASSPSSSSAMSFYTFREFILEQSLTELNTITTQILAMLFEHSRHATALTTGMLRSLFVDDCSATGEESQDNSVASLDRSLSVDARLSYGKRSGGERKRIDLALFFALLYVGHAHSPHRAHYILFDEVFDTLDAGGQAAVVRWCEAMAAARVTYIIVTTHSEHLVSQGVIAGESEQEAGSYGAVLTFKMGKAGVELELDGRRVG